MPEPIHYAAGTLSVLADGDFHVRCLFCDATIEPADMVMLLRVPPQTHWCGVCQDCADDFMSRALDSLVQIYTG